MRNRIIKKNASSSSYDLSISDLMTALCCIFLLFLAVTTVELNKQKQVYQIKNGRAGEYVSMQNDLLEALREEFKDDFPKWKAYISDDLTIHFQDIEVMFVKNTSEITDKFKLILTDFFPRLIAVVSRDEFKDNILEIRIEGHTSVDKSLSAEVNYKRGMATSQERTTNVLFYCLENTKPLYDKIDGEESYEWVRKRIAAIGYSSSIPAEDAARSRRVEIKVRTKAEKAIYEINDLGEEEK